MAKTQPLRVEFWSDVICPFCWVGKRHLDEAVRALRLEDEVEIVPRGFLLNPETSRSRPLRQYLAERFGGPGNVARITGHVRDMGAAVGLDLQFDRAIHAPTVDAQRVILLALDRGLAAPTMERLMRAHFSEGEDLGDRATLRRLAAEAGLDGDEVERVLASDLYLDRLQADILQAQAYGARGVPFVVVDGKYGIVGAQPIEVFVQALARARAERAPPEMVAEGGDVACADDACAAPAGDARGDAA